MNNAHTSLTNGLIFFNADGTCGGWVTNVATGEQVSVRGKVDGDHVVAQGDGAAISYSRVAQPSERGPVARGTVNIAGEVRQISMFRVTTESGLTAHGVSDSILAPRVDAPF